MFVSSYWNCLSAVERITQRQALNDIVFPERLWFGLFPPHAAIPGFGTLEAACYCLPTSFTLCYGDVVLLLCLTAMGTRAKQWQLFKEGHCRHLRCM